MKVKLIDYTGCGRAEPARHAANVLLFTKSTRLEMRPELMSEIEAMPWKEVEANLKYMANTIPSSWEFVNYTFLITDVTRAFTHQFVRTRTGSYAQQTMRVLNVGGWTYGTGPTIPKKAESEEEYCAIGDTAAVDRHDLYHGTMSRVAEIYDALIESGAKIEDARGVLPTNIHTNIVAKFDLRTIADTMRKRASPRTQGEYRSVMDAMRAEIIHVHPWTEMFFSRTFDRAAAELDERIQSLNNEGLIDGETATNMIKLVDQMRGTA